MIHLLYYVWLDTYIVLYNYLCNLARDVVQHLFMVTKMYIVTQIILILV